MSIFRKSFALLLVAAALALGISAIQDLVRERQATLRSAEASVAESLAGVQVVSGPLLVRDCVERWVEETREAGASRMQQRSRQFVVQVPPASLTVHGRLETDTLRRGIFTIPTYVLRAKLAASWAAGAAPPLPSPAMAGGSLQCGPLLLRTTVGDARGIRRFEQQTNGQAVEVSAGPRAREGAAVQSVVPEAVSEGGALQVTIALDLAGTRQLQIVPAGASTQVALTSNWPHPSFGGRYLPLQREVQPDGFSATWQLTSLSARAPQQLREGLRPCHATGDERECAESLSVGLFDPVSLYTLSDRATKYAILFVLLIFGGVGLLEVLGRAQVHPMQYLLVGAAVGIFFLLLLALGEHLGFAWAYLAGAASCSILLAAYAVALFRSLRAGLAFGGAIAALYAVLFLLLRLEDAALLLGALLLFACLAAVMFVTRNVDWSKRLA
jgi:inner membrane protein